MFWAGIGTGIGLGAGAGTGIFVTLGSLDVATAGLFGS